MPGFRQYAATVAVFATVLYVALVVAVFGMISLLADIDVVAAPGAGELVGPIATAVSTLVVLGCLLAIALRVPQNRQRVALLTALFIGAGTYLAWAVAGGIAVTAESGPVSGLIFLGDALTGAFAPSAGVIAFIIAVLFMLVLASRVAERGRTQWRWEKHDDE